MSVSKLFIEDVVETYRVNKLLISFLVLFSCNASSQEGSPDSLSIAELDKRFLYIKNKLNNERDHSYWWQHGWEGYYGASSLVQASLAVTADNSDDEIPNFTMQEEVMDWIEQHENLTTELAKYNLPLEKFRQLPNL